MSLHICHIIRTKTVHDTIAASNGERQSTTIALEITAQLTVYCRNSILRLRLLCALLGFCFQPAFLSSLTLIGFSQFLLARLSICLGLTLCLESCTFCLTSRTLCCSLGFSILLRSSCSGLSLSFLLLGFRFGNPSFILLGSSFCSSLLTCQFLSPLLCCSSFSSLTTSFFLCTFLGCFLCSLTLGLSFCTSLRAGYFLSNQFVDTGIQFRVALLLLVDDALDGFLLFLQRGYHLLLFHLLVFQHTPLFFPKGQQRIFPVLRIRQFVEGFLYLSLHRLHGLTLSLLV